MLNLNIGILGHVDSGKTSLAKALSEVASTAAFDKNPQSKLRGITLDLGFSSFCISTPEHLRSELSDENIQLTLVDCPGHASLIRTIIGGAQIIDLIILVVDVTKGIQTQTAECFVIGEITCKNMIVVLNKVDLLEKNKRRQLIEKVEKRLKHILSTTCFAEAPIVSTVAIPKVNGESIEIEDLIKQISKSAFIPIRNNKAQFLFATDHCFAIKGKGTVITGTVLQGTVSIDDVLDLPAINITKKIKSMQMFKKPVTSASAGDRVGICLTQFDPKLMERGIACAPGFANFVYCGILGVKKIKYFKGSVSSKAKFHITIGHETVMATITCFNTENCEGKSSFDLSLNYQYIECLKECDSVNVQEYLLLEFEKPVLVVDGCTVIGSKLDMDVRTNDCRVAFWGTLLTSCKEKDYKSSYLPTLKICKNKCKTGTVERLVNDSTVIVKNMFKKETNLEIFIGLKVDFSTGEVGIIESSFGQSGKVKVNVKNGLEQNTIKILSTKNKNKIPDNEETRNTPVAVTLSFKKFIYNPNKTVVQ